MLSKGSATDIPQPALFPLEESTGSFEIFPAVWAALEKLVRSEPQLRRNALEQLEALNAPRLSPLVAYVLATRLTDPDLEIRSQVIRLLGDILSPDSKGHPAPDEVRNALRMYLSSLRTRQIYALLQISVIDPSTYPAVARILDACAFAGSHLADILADVHVPIEIRQQAVELIGEVGFTDALPALEKLKNRLEARLNGQKTMPFAPPAGLNESQLLPAIRKSLNNLRAP